MHRRNLYVDSTYLSRLLSASTTKILCYLRTSFSVMQASKSSAILKSCRGQEFDEFMSYSISWYLMFLTDRMEDTLHWRLVTCWFTNAFSTTILPVLRTKSSVNMCGLQSKVRKAEDNITNAECVNPSICVNTTKCGWFIIASVRFFLVIST